MIQDESKNVFSSITKVICLTLVIFSSELAFSVQVEGDISRVGDATHIEFKGLSQWDYELKKINDHEVLLQIPAFDQKTEVALKTWTDQFVDSVKIDKNGIDGRYKVTFQLSGKEVENFGPKKAGNQPSSFPYELP